MSRERNICTAVLWQNLITTYSCHLLRLLLLNRLGRQCRTLAGVKDTRTLVITWESKLKIRFWHFQVLESLSPEIWSASRAEMNVCEYWMISAPGRQTCQQTWDSLQKVRPKPKFSNLKKAFSFSCKHTLDFWNNSEFWRIWSRVSGYYQFPAIDQLEVSHTRLESWHPRPTGRIVGRSRQSRRLRRRGHPKMRCLHERRPWGSKR